MQPDDLDFADNLASLSHSHSQMQDETTCLETVLAGTGLKINRKKTELMKINSTANTPVTLGGECIREVDSFFLEVPLIKRGAWTEMSQPGSAKQEQPLSCSRTSGPPERSAKEPNFASLSVMLYGRELGRRQRQCCRRFRHFINTCLRCIYNIRWPEMIPNKDLWEQAGQEPVAKQILKRKWGWIGHTLQNPASSITCQTLNWNPQRKRKRGQPSNSWRRDTEAELKQQGSTLTGAARTAQSRVHWRRVVDGLCSIGSEGPK